MAKGFTNDGTRYSRSNVDNLKRCQRRYYLNRWAFWDGWNKNASELAKLAYRLKNLSNFWMFGGSIVHRVIAELLTAGRALGNWPEVLDVEPLLERARELWQAGYSESQNGKWRRKVKGNLNLREHYYGRGLWRTGDGQLRRGGEPGKMAKMVGARITDSLRGFSGLWPDLRESLQTGEILSIEEFQRFQWGGAEFVMAYDLALALPDGVTAVFDWKTGKPRVEDDEQGALYLWALGRQREGGGEVVLAYLPTGDQKRYTAMGLNEDQLRQEIAEIQEADSHLRQAERLEWIPPPADLDECLDCPFWEICHGGREIVDPEKAEWKDWEL